MTTVEEWDAHWQKVYDRQIAKGAIPNQAIPIADGNTERSLGERPPVEQPRWVGPPLELPAAGEAQ